MTDVVNVGTTDNDGNGDTLRAAFSQINTRFNELLSTIDGGDAWATGVTYTATPIRQWVINAGQAYVAAINHVSGASFAADLSAGKWFAVDSAQILADLAAPTGASLIGYTPTGLLTATTVEGALNEVRDASKVSYTPAGAVATDVHTAIRSLDAYAGKNHIYNINSTTFSVAHNANVNGLNYDKQVYLFGDSHGWGQGAPEWDQFSGTDYSSHSASIFNLGFMSRIESYIKRKCNFDEKVYSVFGTVGQRIIPNDVIDVDAITSGVDFLSSPLRVAHGLVKVQEAEIVTTVSSSPAWFTPFANNVGDDISYKVGIYRDKLFKGRFNKQIAEMQIEGTSNFLECGKTEYLTLTPLPGVAASGGAFVAVVDSNSNVLAEYNDGVAFYIRINNNSDYLSIGFSLLTAGTTIFIPGFGKVVTADIVNLTTGYAIKIFAADGASYPTGLNKFIYAGMKIYRDDYISHTTTYVNPSHPFRLAFIAFKSGPGGRKFNIQLVDGNTASLDPKPWGHHSSTVAANSSLVPLWNWDRTGLPLVYVVSPSGDRIPLASGTSGIVIGADYISVDTYNATSIDNVLCIDFGARVHGRLLIDDAGYTAPSTGVNTYIRGVMFDNNGVTNYSMGAHSIGDWLGLSASYVDAARDHLGDIIAYAKVTPYFVITELPLVNEYLRQTSLVDFKNNIATFISRITSTLNPGATKKTDFLFFTSTGGMDVDYAGATSSAITYDAYANAALEQCIASGAGFVDCRSMLKDLVNSGLVDYTRLFADNNHPSSFANEYIAKKIIDVIDRII